MEEKEALKGLDNFDLDFDLHEVSVNNMLYNLLLRRHHGGICLDIIV